MSRIAATDEAWAEAVRIVHEQMRVQQLTDRDIKRLSGPTQNTLRSMLLHNKIRNASSWLALSRALGLGDTLLRIIEGERKVRAGPQSPIEQRLAELVAEMAKIDALQERVDVLHEVVREIDQKIDSIIAGKATAQGPSKPKPLGPVDLVPARPSRASLAGARRRPRMVRLQCHVRQRPQRCN